MSYLCLLINQAGTENSDFVRLRLITKGYFLLRQMVHFSHWVTKSNPSHAPRYRLKTCLRWVGAFYESFSNHWGFNRDDTYNLVCHRYAWIVIEEHNITWTSFSGIFHKLRENVGWRIGLTRKSFKSISVRLLKHVHFTSFSCVMRLFLRQCMWVK